MVFKGGNMKFKFCDLAHYSAMNLESFLDHNEIKFIKDEVSSDQIERLYDITIMNDDVTINTFNNVVRISIYSKDDLIASTKIHITEFSTLKIF
jgi:hypothetical protein